MRGAGTLLLTIPGALLSTGGHRGTTGLVPENVVVQQVRPSRRGLLTAVLGGAVLAVSGCSLSEERRHSRKAERVDVRRFGAQGRGGDDSSAFRSAIRFAQRRGVSVYVPRGRFLLSEEGRTLACLTLPAGTRLVGRGVIGFRAGARRSCKLLRVTGSNVLVRDVTLDLTDAPAGTSFGISIGESARHVVVEGVTIRDNPHRGGIQITGGRDIAITRCQILRMKQNGITLYGRGPGNGPRGVVVDNCRISADTQPIDSEPVNGATSQDIVVSKCVLISTGANYALTLSGSRNTVVRDSILRGALYLTNAESADIHGNVIDSTASPRLHAVYATYEAKDCTVRDNEIVAAPGRAGVWVSRAEDKMPKGWIIQDNRIRVSMGGAVGIYTSDVQDLLITGNRVQGRRGGLGIGVDAARTSLKATVRDNEVTGFVTGVQARSRAQGSLRVEIRDNVVDSPVSLHQGAGIVVRGRRTEPELSNNRLPSPMPGGGLRVER